MAIKINGRKLSNKELKEVKGGIKGVGFFCWDDWITEDPFDHRPESGWCPDCQKWVIVEVRYIIILIAGSQQRRCSECHKLFTSKTVGYRKF